MLPKFVSSNDICNALGISKRTLQRRFHCARNPLPPACIKRVGGASKWEEGIALAWLEREGALGNKSSQGGVNHE